MGKNSDEGISDFRISGQSLVNENFNDSRISNDIDMKLGPVTKLDKRNTTRLKNLAIRSFQEIVTSLLFFRFMTTLEQSESWILDTWSVKVTFSLIVTFFSSKN